MLTRSLALVTVALAAALAPVTLHAQVGGPPTADRFTMAGAFARGFLTETPANARVAAA